MVTTDTFINAVRNNPNLPIFMLNNGSEDEILDHRLVYAPAFGHEESI